MFQGRNLVIATKHHKEAVIAPIVTAALGVTCQAVTELDTDILGTFTGEVERTGDPLTTARKKCLLAMELSGCDLAIANEGSFGPHPSLYFVPADSETMIFIDKKNDLEVSAHELSTETNYSSEQITNEAELHAFAARVKFPEHHVILRKSPDDNLEIRKGINNWPELLDYTNRYLRAYGRVWIETDMRAMANPMRMNVIKAATLKLVKKINSLCPSCGFPGFDVTEVRYGLPCSLCASPTRSVLSYVYRCPRCAFTNEVMYPTGRTTEDPMYCDQCNP